MDAVTRPEPRDCRATSWQLITAKMIKVEIVHIPTGTAVTAEATDDQAAIRAAWSKLMIDMVGSLVEMGSA